MKKLYKEKCVTTVTTTRTHSFLYSAAQDGVRLGFMTLTKVKTKYGVKQTYPQTPVDVTSWNVEITPKGIQAYEWTLMRHSKIRLMPVNEHVLWLQEQFYELCEQLELQSAPIVYIGLLKNYAVDVDMLKDRSNGWSLLNEDVDREGIVIKGSSNDWNRVVFKQRSPEYLTKG